MAARLTLVLVVLAFPPGEAFAQMRAMANQAPAVLNSLSPRDASPSIGQGFGTPNTYDLANQRYGLGAPHGYAYPNCNPYREAMARRTAMMQTRRTNEADRRKAARERLAQSPNPTPATAEQKAASAFGIAHAYYKAGKPLLARERLDEILNKFPDTKTADKAMLVLTRF